MKKSYQHIIKKSYTTPKIEEVEIDVAISLGQPTVSEEEVEEPTGGSKNISTSPYKTLSGPDYREDTYQSPDSPF